MRASSPIKLDALACAVTESDADAIDFFVVGGVARPPVVAVAAVGGVVCAATEDGARGGDSIFSEVTLPPPPSRLPCPLLLPPTLRPVPAFPLPSLPPRNVLPNDSCIIMRVRSASAGPSEFDLELRPLPGVLTEPRRPAPHSRPPGRPELELADHTVGAFCSGSDWDDQLSLSLPVPVASLATFAATSVAASSAAAKAAETGSPAGAEGAASRSAFMLTSLPRPSAAEALAGASMLALGAALEAIAVPVAELSCCFDGGCCASSVSSVFFPSSFSRFTWCSSLFSFWRDDDSGAVGAELAATCDEADVVTAGASRGGEATTTVRPMPGVGDGVDLEKGVGEARFEWLFDIPLSAGE